MNPSYSHTQKGPWTPIMMLIGAALLAAAAFTPVQDIGTEIALAVGGGCLFLFAPCFHHLTVADEGDFLAIRFGYLPLFQKRIPYETINSVEVGRTTFLDGWGIHRSLRGGWVWNIWGRDCVVIHHPGIFRVGTDDVENLAAFLHTKMPASHTGRDEPSNGTNPSRA